MRPLVSPSIEALRPYAAGKPLEELSRERGIHDAIKLASNENPFGPSPRVLQAIIREASRVHRYPDARVHDLRQRLAEHLGVAPSELVFGNGSNELIDLVLSTFTLAGDHVVFAEPSFVVYRSSCLAHGLPHTAVNLSDYRHDLPAMLAAVTERTRVVFIANPNNPTGTYVGAAELAEFLSALPREVIAVVDEAYFEYATASDFASALSMREVHERLIVLRTFSKAYALAGLRLGYAVAPARLADYLDRVRAPFTANSLAQAAALVALDDRAHLQQCAASNAAERARVTSALEALGLVVVPSQANFVWVRFGRPAAPLFERLLDQGVITRAVPAEGDALRITIGTPEENTRLLSAVAQVLR